MLSGIANRLNSANSCRARKDKLQLPLTLIDDSKTSTQSAEKKYSILELRTLANRTAIYSKQDINKLIPLFEKVISLVLLYRQNNVCNWEKIILRLIKNIFGENLTDVSSIQCIRKCFTDVLRWNCRHSAVEISENLEENNFDFYFKSISFRIFQEAIRWNVTSHVLSNEKKMTIPIPIARRRQHWTMKTQTSHCSGTSIRFRSSSSAAGDFAARSLVPAENLMDIQKNENCHQLRLLCVFTSNLNFEDYSETKKTFWGGHDVKILLPKVYNVVLSKNTLTISHENNREIRLIFRNSLKTIKIDYENQNFPSIRNCNLAKILKSNNTIMKKNIENPQAEQTNNLLNTGTTKNNEHEDSNVVINRSVRTETVEEGNQDLLAATNTNTVFSNNKHTITKSSRSKSICQCHLQYLLRKKILLNAISENSDISDTAINQDKHKFPKIPKKNTRTAFKRVNVKQIVSSAFKHFFHFYSLIGGHLRSGVVITKSNSNYWLIVAGVVTDSRTLKLAEDLFNVIAGAKVVLNIFDYLRFLIVFARNRRIIVADLVKQMMVWEEPFAYTTKDNLQSKLSETIIS